MIEVKFNLDPINDGIEISKENPNTEETEARDIEGECIVMATNGDCDIVGLDTAIAIMQKLGDDTLADFIGKTPYALACNKKKVLTIDGTKYLIGSALIVNLKNGIVMDEDDMYEAMNQFESRFVELKLGPDTTVIAYEF